MRWRRRCARRLGMNETMGQKTTDDRRPTTEQASSRLRWLVVGGQWSVVSGWRADALLALAAGLLAVLLLALAYTRAWPLAVDIGTRDDRFVAGFNATEDFGGRLVRWTNGDATIALPRPPDGRPALL